MSENNLKHLHIAMCPWFAVGHITYFLHLANKLAERAHKISFFIPPKTQARLIPHNRHPHLITFIPIKLPPIDGLPTWAETTNDVPASARPLIMTAMDQTQGIIDAHLSNLGPDFIFFDFAEWVPKLAHKHHIKSIFYSTFYVVTFAYITPQVRNLPFNRLTEKDLMEPPPYFPCPSIRLQHEEASGLAKASGENFGGSMSLLERLSISFQECDGIGFKTCREMEGPYCDYFSQHYGKPLLLAGPVVPETPRCTLDGYFDYWLKRFGVGCVVYCALGSECFLQMDQFQELVLGLELTGLPFLAALKPPTNSQTIESALPQGFTERTKARGIVHGGWVQQQLILNHASVGCFLTHCGAGSLSEAMASQCQLVMMPQAVDQFINARLMSLDLRVGVEVERNPDVGLFTREAICRAVLTVMDRESRVGKEVRAKHDSWRGFLTKNGVEDAYISGFIQNLHDLLG